MTLEDRTCQMFLHCPRASMGLQLRLGKQHHTGIAVNNGLDLDRARCQLTIAVGTPVARCPPHRPGRALMSASGSYRG